MASNRKAFHFYGGLTFLFSITVNRECQEELQDYYINKINMCVF